MIVVKKGFTLIELLAVILILGIIALIAIPTVNNILVESRERAFVVTVTNLSDAISNKCYTETIKGVEITTIYTITNGVITPELEIKGDLPDKGKIYVNTDCEVKLEVNNQNTLLKKDYDEKDFIIEDYVENNNSYAGTSFTIGDLVVIDEKNWRVLKNSPSDEETVSLIAEYVFPDYVAVTTEENDTKVWKETRLNERLNTVVDGTKNEFGYDLSLYEELETFINDSYDINGGQALNPGTKMRLINIQEYYAFKNHATNIGDITWAYYSDSGTENGIRFGESNGGWWTMSINSNRTDRFWMVDNLNRTGSATVWCVSYSACNHLKPVIKVKKENLENILFRQE